MPGRRKNKRGRKPGKSSDSPTAAKKQKVNVAEVEDDNNKTGTSYSPTEKALQNTLVLQNVFKFLPYKDLQACQYVDLPLWSSEAQHAVSQRPIVHVVLRNIKAFMFKAVGDTRFQFQVDGVADLPVQLENHGKGHEIWLTLDQFDMTLEGWEKFLEKFGHAVSYLKFNDESLDKLLVPDFQKLLSRFSNLSYLSISTPIPPAWKSCKETSTADQSSSSFESDSSILLPQIKTVSFSASYDENLPEFLMNLSGMMPNLKNVFNFPLNCIPKSAAHDQLKLDKIRSINFPTFPEHDSDQMIAELLQLGNVSPGIKIKMAHLPLKMFYQEELFYSKKVWKSCFKSWSSVLRNSKNSLEYLIIEPLALPEILVYPELKAVKKICLYVTDYYEKSKPVKFFVPGFDVARTFPNLMEVTLRSLHCKMFQCVKLFPEDAFTGNRNYFRGVTTLDLKLENFGDLDSLEKVALLFPNVTRFSITFTFRWLENRLNQIVRLWPKLTSLKLRVDLGYTNWINRKFPLDSVFTGISSRKCNELRKNKEKMDIDIEDYRQEFAISKMTDLKELTVVFGGVKYYTHHKLVPFFSHVTPFYGFQLVPDLKVTFAIPGNTEYNKEIREMLSPIEKYVIFNPDYYEPDGYYHPETPSNNYWC